MKSFMTKKKDLKADIMSEISEEEIRMTGMYDTHYYNYRCRDCGFKRVKALDKFFNLSVSRFAVAHKTSIFNDICMEV